MASTMWDYLSSQDKPRQTSAFEWAGLGTAGVGALADLWGSIDASNQGWANLNWQKGLNAEKVRAMQKMWGGLQPYYQSLLSGGDSPQIGALNKYFQQALQNLGQQEGFALNRESQNAGAIAASRGYNPYNFVQHSRANVYNSFAPQSGQLLANMLSEKSSMNQNFLNALLNLKSQFAQQGA